MDAPRAGTQGVSEELRSFVEGMPYERRSIFQFVSAVADSLPLGATVLDVEGVKALATLPSLDELRAKILGLLVAPATKLATITQAPAAQLARVLMAYADKDTADA